MEHDATMYWTLLLHPASFLGLHFILERSPRIETMANERKFTASQLFYYAALSAVASFIAQQVIRLLGLP